MTLLAFAGQDPTPPWANRTLPVYDLPTPTPLEASLAGPCVGHNDRAWHGVWNQVKRCYYDHHHGDRVSAMNGAFQSSPGWAGKAISYPWATPNENELKHTGYMWLGTRNLPDEPLLTNMDHDYSDDPWYHIMPATGPIVAARCQTHTVPGGVAALTRTHSFLCQFKVTDPTGTQVGLVTHGGHQDTGQLHADYKTTWGHRSQDAGAAYPDPPTDGLGYDVCNVHRPYVPGGTAWFNNGQRVWRGTEHVDLHGFPGTPVNVGVYRHYDGFGGCLYDEVNGELHLDEASPPPFTFDEPNHYADGSVWRVGLFTFKILPENYDILVGVGAVVDGVITFTGFRNVTTGVIDLGCTEASTTCGPYILQGVPDPSCQTCAWDAWHGGWSWQVDTAFCNAPVDVCRSGEYMPLDVDGDPYFPPLSRVWDEYLQ